VDVISAGRVVLGKAGRFTALTSDQGHPAASAHGVYSDARGQIIVSDVEGRVLRASGERLEPWLDARGIVPGTFAGINVEATGAVWARHDHTLSWWTGDRWQRLQAPTGEKNLRL
jgi:hypothetical protein